MQAFIYDFFIKLLRIYICLFSRFSFCQNSTSNYRCLRTNITIQSTNKNQFHSKKLADQKLIISSQLISNQQQKQICCKHCWWFTFFHLVVLRYSNWKLQKQEKASFNYESWWWVIKTHLSSSVFMIFFLSTVEISYFFASIFP